MSSDAKQLKKHQFKPGESGNPGGRPKKGQSITELIERVGQEPEDHEPKGPVSKAERAVRDQWARAGKNETTFAYLVNRVDGKPVQQIRVSGDVEMDAPIHIHIAGLTIERDDDEDGAAGE